MVTVVKRPIGHKIIDQVIPATIIDSGGDALVEMMYHSLSEGDYIYLEADIDEYAGLWFVTPVTGDTFKISEYDGAPFVPFYQEAEVDYYQTRPHDWNSVFLPIIYKASNDRWPVNTVDTERTIVSFSDDNGYTAIVPSGTIKSSMHALEYVKISGSSDPALNAVWQIVEVIGLTIDLPYSASNALVGATIQYYYNNYQVKVKVFAGLDPSHPWYTKKPFVEVAELLLTPDEDNIAMFSVSDYIKSKVAIKNNPTLFSMPLNLDAFTGFYISVSESYDISDGYTLGTEEAAFVDDDFQGYAVAGKLPFKNRYSGDYADYVYTSGSPAMWLTVLERLLAVQDFYFDISFIKNIIGDFSVVIEKTFSDYTVVETIAMTDQGIGVYRIQLQVDATYEEYCVRIYKAPSAGFTPAVMDALDTWANIDTGGEDWVLNGAVPEIDFDLLGLGIDSNDWHTDYAFEVGQIYTFDYEFKGSNTAGIYHIEIVDASNNMIIQKTISTNPETVTGSYEFPAPIGAAGITIWFENVASCGGECLARLISFTNETPSEAPSDSLPITVEICMDVIDACQAKDGFTPENIRLLEDEGYRLLE